MKKCWTMSDSVSDTIAENGMRINVKKNYEHFVYCYAADPTECCEK